MRSVTIGLAALLALSACGGEDDSSPDDVKVTSLDQAESADLCEWLQGLEDKSITDAQICTQQGSQSADEPEACEAERDRCLMELTGPEDCDSFKVPRSCQATVAEFKSCLSAFTKELNAATKRATCEDPTKGRLDGLPASCANVTPCLVFNEEG